MPAYLVHLVRFIEYWSDRAVVGSAQAQQIVDIHVNRLLAAFPDLWGYLSAAAQAWILGSQ